MSIDSLSFIVKGNENGQKSKRGAEARGRVCFQDNKNLQQFFMKFPDKIPPNPMKSSKEEEG